jgi:hypothetical protein
LARGKAPAKFLSNIRLLGKIFSKTLFLCPQVLLDIHNQMPSSIFINLMITMKIVPMVMLKEALEVMAMGPLLFGNEGEVR